MSGARQRLVALAVALAPGRAAALLSRLGPPDGGPSVALATSLAGAPRRARLMALASALASATGGEPPRSPGLHPLLDRLRREGARSAGRTLVRAAAQGRPEVT